jgi:hypothetical protein
MATALASIVEIKNKDKWEQVSFLKRCCLLGSVRIVEYEVNLVV